MYEQIARWYDAIHAGLTEDVPFVVAWARENGPQGGALLEAGCGTGRLVLPLAQAGLRVTGVDNSAEMLARAEQAVTAAGVAERVALVSADLATAPPLPGSPFDLILFSHNTLNHFPTTALETLLRTARRQSAPGGHLLLDIANPFLLADLEDDPEWELERTFGEESDTPVAQYSRWFHDDEKQQVRVEWLFVTPDGERISAETLYHYTWPHLLTDLLQAAGWEPLALCGNYDSSPFDEESDRLIVLAAARA
jgi:SAM-dependent methyltransferase